MALKTSLYLGTAEGTFTQVTLPIQAQYAPVFALTSLDFNKDGFTDLLLAGNTPDGSIKLGKYDASYGVLLEGKGRGEFKYVPQETSGLFVRGAVRGMLPVNNQILFGLNDGALQAYKSTKD